VAAAAKLRIRVPFFSKNHATLIVSGGAYVGERTASNYARDEFVAAARLRRVQEAALAARPIGRNWREWLRSTMARIQEPQHPLLERREEKTYWRLCWTRGTEDSPGRLNANIFAQSE